MKKLNRNLMNIHISLIPIRLVMKQISNLGDELMKMVAKKRCHKWVQMVEEICMSGNSRKS